MRLTISLGSIAVSNIVITVIVQWYILVEVGLSFELDAFFASQTIPLTLLAIMTASLNPVLVPLLAVTDPERFSQDAWGFFTVVGLTLLSLCALLYFLAPYWVPLLFPGFTDTTQSLAIGLTRVQLPSIVFMALSVVLGAAYHARQRFYWVQVAAMLGTVTMLIGIVWALPKYGIWAVAWSSVLRTAIQTVLLLPGIGRYRAVRDSEPLFSAAWARMKPLLLGSTVFKLGPIIDRYLASLAPTGALSLLAFGHQVYAAALQVSDRAVASPFVPRAAKYVGGREFAALWRGYKIRLAWVVAIAFSIFTSFVVFGRDLLDFALRYGQVYEQNITVLWGIMVVLGGMLLGGVAGQLSAAGLNAMGATRVVTGIALIGFGLSILVKAAGFFQLGVYGIALGIAFYQIFNAAFLHRALVRELDHPRA